MLSIFRIPVLLFFIISMVLSGCKSYEFYHSTADVPRTTSNCKTVMDYVKFDDFNNSDRTFYSRIGAMIARDRSSDRQTDYVLLYPRQQAGLILDYSDTAVLDRKNLKELIAAVDESIEYLKLKNSEAKHDKIFLEFNVVPEPATKDGNNLHGESRNSLSYRFTCSNKRQFATISFLRKGTLESLLLLHYTFEEHREVSMLHEMEYFSKYLKACLEQLG